MQTTLAGFREQESTESFSLQNSKMLKVELQQVSIQAKLGSMVAYQGEVAFEHAGSGGMGRFVKKALTGEGTQLMKITGQGEVFLADQAQDIHLIKLENDGITCNGRNVLAFDADIDWDITKADGGMGSMLAGGLFNMSLSGSGWVAVVSDGPPVLLTARVSWCGVLGISNGSRSGQLTEALLRLLMDTVGLADWPPGQITPAR